MEVPIYLDNNSTTPLDPLVLEAMLPFFTTHFGNPSNVTHAMGERAAAAVERARTQVAELVGAEPREIFFTSGATESNNLAILGVARKVGRPGDHIITVATEHRAVLGPCRKLESEGLRLTVLPVDGTGRVDPRSVADAITERTVLVSVMAANNEVGTLQPLSEIGAICGERGVLLHTDAAQAMGKVPLDVDELGVDLLSVSAHKMYGPKGGGALYVRGSSRKIPIEPLCYGGGQERDLRPGTIPVPNVVGLGQASAIARERLQSESDRLRVLRDRLRDRLIERIPQVIIQGHPTERLPGLLSVTFPGADGDQLIHALREIAVSQGASCSAGSFEPSHVLRAIGLPDDLARATIRFGVGRFIAEEEIDFAAEYVATTLHRLAELALPARPGR